MNGDFWQSFLMISDIYTVGFLVLLCIFFGIIHYLYRKRKMDFSLVVLIGMGLGCILGILMQYMAGGASFDSLLRLHPDGNSARSTMLVINGTPVGFLNWEALDAIESQDISSSEDVMDILSQGKDWFKAI